MSRLSNLVRKVTGNPLVQLAAMSNPTTAALYTGASTLFAKKPEERISPDILLTGGGIGGGIGAALPTMFTGVNIQPRARLGGAPMSKVSTSRTRPVRKSQGPGVLEQGAELIKKGIGGRTRSAGGVVRHHRRGITARELRGFNKVSGMLARFGMVPRKMKGARLRKRARC